MSFNASPSNQGQPDDAQCEITRKRQHVITNCANNSILKLDSDDFYNNNCLRGETSCRMNQNWAIKFITIFLLTQVNIVSSIDADLFPVDKGVHTLQKGERAMHLEPDDELLHTERPMAKGKFLRKTGNEYCYPPKGSTDQVKITKFEVFDQDIGSSGGLAFESSGGVGQSHVCVFIKSQTGGGYRYLINIYGFRVRPGQPIPSAANTHSQHNNGLGNNLNGMQMMPNGFINGMQMIPNGFGMGNMQPGAYGMGNMQPGAYGMGNMQPGGIGMGNMQPGGIGMGNMQPNNGLGIGNMQNRAVGSTTK